MAVLQRLNQAAGRVGVLSSSLPAASQVAQVLQSVQPSRDAEQPCWVFLGPPGVGKGTYSGRIAEAMGVPHISAGDLVRNEIGLQSSVGLQAAAKVRNGELLSDSLMFQLLQNRLDRGREQGADGFLLDGFPRTLAQAQALTLFTDVHLAVNLHVRQEVLIEKCLGRRVCTHCRKNYNVANINIPATATQPAIHMPPLDPPPECQPFLEIRSDDNLVTVQRRLEVYQDEAQPVEDFFRRSGLLLDFEITGGIPETMPVLQDALRPYLWRKSPPPQQAVQSA